MGSYGRRIVNLNIINWWHRKPRDHYSLLIRWCSCKTYHWPIVSHSASENKSVFLIGLLNYYAVLEEFCTTDPTALPLVDLSQLHSIRSPMVQARVTANVTPAAVIAFTNPVSRVSETNEHFSKASIHPHKCRRHPFSYFFFLAWQPNVDFTMTFLNI
jgi:hypothetical protein